MLSNILIALVAALHVYFMYLEMVAWDRPLGRKVFRTTSEFATASKALAAN
jgi:putative membrane protein